MRITTWNVNGIRAAIRKGFERHIDQIQPDILLLQEVRAMPDQIPDHIVESDGWHIIWNPAERRGYSGTAIWSRNPLSDIQFGLKPKKSEPEGRLIECRTPDVQFATVYLPSGSSGPERQAVKDRWLRQFKRWAKDRADSSPMVLGGDLNIAHTASDIFYAKSNEKSSGFLPHERAWMGRLIKSGWHDLVREHFGDVQGPYSWWSNRGRARELDRGWRIDYLLANAAARPFFKSATIHREAALEVSDHAPVSIDLEL
jgi:exodeoxyribonuclease III